VARSVRFKLNPFILAHPEATFVLFHGGFPWHGTIAALAKNIPNVYIDMVWLPHMSRETAVVALQQWLDCVPYTSTSAFWRDHFAASARSSQLASVRRAGVP
jgi:hypothetical protein